MRAHWLVGILFTIFRCSGNAAVSMGTGEGGAMQPGDDGGHATGDGQAKADGPAAQHDATTPDSACGNTTSDSSNCGRCGLVCAAGTACVNSVCSTSCTG